MRGAHLPPRPWLRRARACALALVAGVGTAAAAGQFSASVTLVEVYATVTDADGRPVTDLGRDAFVVREDAVAREVQAFAAGEFPLSVALAVDRSWSMAGEPLDQARAASRRFLDELRPADDAMVIGVSSEVETLAPLSHDRAAQQAALAALTPWGSTKLHDAILEAHGRIGAARGRRALLIFSDGQDRGSVASVADVVARVRLADVIVYPVVLGEKNSSLLVQLAAFTGGRAFWIRRASEIEGVFADIARELRHQYLIGFVPAGGGTRGATWRRITVEVPGRNVRVRARPGYFE